MSRLPAGFVVTRFAVAAIRPMLELSGMLIRVAIETSYERDFSFEILGLVAILASHSRMFAKQRIVGLAMVKTIRRKNLLPASSHVAACAIPAKTAAVGVLMARRAIVEKSKVLVLDSRTHGRRTGPVALGALQISV